MEHIGMVDKILNIEKVVFKSNMDEPQFRKKLEKLFKQKAFDFTHNLSGKMVGANKFALTEKWGFIIWRGFDGSNAYLNGEIIKTEDGLTIVASIRPNSTLFLIFIGFLIVTSIPILDRGIGNASTDDIISILLVFPIWLAQYFFGRSLRIKIRERFKDYFGLKEVQ